MSDNDSLDYHTARTIGRQVSDLVAAELKRHGPNAHNEEITAAALAIAVMHLGVIFPQIRLLTASALIKMKDTHNDNNLR